MPTKTDLTLYSTTEAAPLVHPELSPRTLEAWRRAGKPVRQCGGSARSAAATRLRSARRSSSSTNAAHAKGLYALNSACRRCTLCCQGCLLTPTGDACTMPLLTVLQSTMTRFLRPDHDDEH